MPPPIPIYALDCKKKNRKTGVMETRQGMFFGEVHLHREAKLGKDDLLEFGQSVFGPLRSTSSEAQADVTNIQRCIENEGASGLRRWISKMAPLGGTRSSPNPSVVPVLSNIPGVSLHICESGDSVKVTGIRRPNISALLDGHAPVRIIERAIDLLTDLLSSVVDSQLGILPPQEDLVAVLKYSFSRNNGQCPVPDGVFVKYIIPLTDAFLRSPVWATVLHAPIEGSDDLEVIHGFLSQFLDKARQADIFGERKQARRINKKNRSKKLAKHTVFVTNIPKSTTEKELFEVFESGLGNEEKHVYKAVIMRDSRTNKSRGFGRVIFRNAKATKAALEKSGWELCGRLLYLESYIERAAKENEIDNEDSESESGHDYPGLYDFLPSPKKPHRIFQLPPEIELSVREIVRKHPEGCPLSNLADLVDSTRYGFRSLTDALKSVEGLHVEPMAGKKGAYVVKSIQ